MVWSKIAQVFSFGSQWGDNTVRLVEGTDAAAMLKRVEGILEDSLRVLLSHERVLTQGELNSFSVKHRNLLLKVIEVKQEVYDEKSQATPPADLAEREPFRLDQEISRLYQEARIYRRDVIRASRRAQANVETTFEDLSSTENKLGLSGAPEVPDPATTWYSVIAPSTRSLIDSLDVSEAGSDTSTLVGREPFLAVARVRPQRSCSSDLEGSADSETYREVLILESNEKTVILFNPSRRYLDRGLDPSDEASLLEMSRAGEALLQATNPQKLQGYEVIASQHETSWVDSFVSTLSRLGVGIGADMM
ncbi:hypothetical protein OPQ81_011937 [Rhizoctonia solani]|nr:hypothetical protein OPQ81_011937 [Rhizoctonia solani]